MNSVNYLEEPFSIINILQPIENKYFDWYIVKKSYMQKNSNFLYLKWWVAQQIFSQLLPNESVRALTPLLYIIYK